VAGNCKLACNLSLCLTCSSTTVGKCQTCSPGLSKSYDQTVCVTCTITSCSACSADNVCAVCNSGLYFQNNLCISCNVPNCLVCSSNNVCSTCATSYALNQGAASANQCTACLDPCASCNSDGTCLTCSAPYSQLQLPQGTTCFLCADPNCQVCNSTTSKCTTCNPSYTVSASGTCQASCAANCQDCSGAGGSCVKCIDFYYLQPNGSCAMCASALKCYNCLPSNSSQCQDCNYGYYNVTDGNGINTGSCSVCAGYCQICLSIQRCVILTNPNGFTLTPTGTNTNNLAVCDPGCLTCSSYNPQLCSLCQGGYYLSSNLCTLCTAASFCMSCSPSAPATCLSCFPGAFLNTNNVCVQCMFPCTSCASGTATSCTSCFIGYILSASACVAISTLPSTSTSNLQNCANAFNTTTNTLVCTLCLQGYTQTPSGCAPCVLGCLTCNPAQLTTCTTCAPGYFLNSTSNCQACISNCVQCSSVGCMQCTAGYTLNAVFNCQLNCIAPCAECKDANPSACTSCVAGYVLNQTTGTCSPDVSCSSTSSCFVCPYGYSLQSASVPGKIIQTCQQCNTTSNCARCSLTNTSQCLSCPMGYFLNSGVCTACSTGCGMCFSKNFCTVCNVGFVPQQAGGISFGNPANGLVNCLFCTSPCMTCIGTPTYCTSCVSGYTLQGPVCMSNFNFQIKAVFVIDVIDFQKYYLALLNLLDTAAQTNISNILILSIASGSAIINAQISTSVDPSSSQASTINSNLNNLFSSGSVAGMPLNSYSLTTNGGSIPSGGLSTKTIIILSTVIPIGVICIFELT